MLKAEAMRNRWVPAVRRLGTLGRWAFDELTDHRDFGPGLDAAIADANAQTEPAQ